MDRGIQEGKKIGKRLDVFFIFGPSHGQSGNLPARFPLQESMSSNDGYNANMVVLHMSSSLKRRRDRGGASTIGIHYGYVSHQQVRRTGNGANHTENTALSRPWFKRLKEVCPDFVETLIGHSHTDEARRAASASNGITGDRGAAFILWANWELITAGLDFRGPPAAAWEEDTAAVVLMQSGSPHAPASASHCVWTDESLAGGVLLVDSPREERILHEVPPPPPAPLRQDIRTPLERHASLVCFALASPTPQDAFHDDEYFGMPKVETLFAGAFDIF